MDKLTRPDPPVDGIVWTDPGFGFSSGRYPLPEPGNTTTRPGGSTWTTGSWVTPAREKPYVAPRVGDRVKVTVEGVVVSASAYGLEVGKSWIDPTAPEVTSVEIVAADSGWQRGDVVSCEHGLSFLRSADQWVTHGGTKIVEPCDGPLTLLVRGGRTV